MPIKPLLKKVVDILPVPVRNKAYRASSIVFGLKTLTSMPFYDMYRHIANLKKLGFNPDLIIDVGACFGQWTENVHPIFPQAAFIMIEPQSTQQHYLQKLTHKLSNTSLEFALVGDTEKESVDFYQMGTGSSMYPENSDHAREKLSLKMETIDCIIKQKYRMPNNCFIKLDVQGAEIDVLKGAAEVLKKTEFVLLEISTLNYNQRAPQFAEVIIYLKSIGFVLFDICDERRMRNEVLYQTDMIFAQESSPIRQSVDFK